MGKRTEGVKTFTWPCEHRVLIFLQVFHRAKDSAAKPQAWCNLVKTKKASVHWKHEWRTSLSCILSTTTSPRVKKNLQWLIITKANPGRNKSVMNTAEQLFYPFPPGYIPAWPLGAENYIFLTRQENKNAPKTEIFSYSNGSLRFGLLKNQARMK